LRRIQPDEVNLLFVCAFTEATQLAYALSHYYRSKGAVTVIGGPHARCYPEDAQQHFDYVLGFTDRQLLQDVLADTSPHRPLGLRLQADRQPTCLPLRRYVEGESDVLPPFYHDMIRKELGSMWEWLPEEALSHNPYAYLST